MLKRCILQPEGSNLCGQACVAMIAGITLEESIAVFGKRGCTTTRDVVKALRKAGVSCGESLVRIKRQGRQGKPPLCMAVLHFRGTGRAHWTVYSAGRYFDPGMGILDALPEAARETSYLPIYGRAKR